MIPNKLPSLKLTWFLCFNVLFFLILATVNNISYAAPVDDVQNYLASQICNTASNDATSQSTDSCKNSLRDAAQKIADTCGAKTEDQKLICVAEESKKVSDTTDASGVTDDPKSNELHQADASASGKFFNYVTIFFTILSALAGVAMVGSFVVSGIQYATAGDNAGAITKAKTRIVYTIIALVLYIMLFLIATWLIPSDVIT